MYIFFVGKKGRREKRERERERENEEERGEREGGGVVIRCEEMDEVKISGRIIKKNSFLFFLFFAEVL